MLTFPWRRLKEFWYRLTVVPFESAVALIVMVSAGLALAKYGGVQTDPIAKALPWLLLGITQVLYLVAGLGMTFGLGTGKGNVEAFGIIMLIVGLLVRSVGIVYVVHLHAVAVTSLLFNVVFVYFAYIRLQSLRRREVIVKAEGLE